MGSFAGGRRGKSICTILFTVCLFIGSVQISGTELAWQMSPSFSFWELLFAP